MKKKKTAKEVKMNKFSVCACKFFAQLQDRKTVTVRNGSSKIELQHPIWWGEKIIVITRI